MRKLLNPTFYIQWELNPYTGNLFGYTGLSAYLRYDIPSKMI
jgi:hypothetical protein